MNGQVKAKRKNITVQLREPTYERLVRHRESLRLKPSLVEMTSAALEHWLDEQERAEVRG